MNDILTHTIDMDGFSLSEFVWGRHVSYYEIMWDIAMLDYVGLTTYDYKITLF